MHNVSSVSFSHAVLQYTEYFCYKARVARSGRFSASFFQTSVTIECVLATQPSFLDQTRNAFDYLTCFLFRGRYARQHIQHTVCVCVCTVYVYAIGKTAKLLQLILYLA